MSQPTGDSFTFLTGAAAFVGAWATNYTSGFFLSVANVIENPIFGSFLSTVILALFYVVDSHFRRRVAREIAESEQAKENRRLDLLTRTQYSQLIDLERRAVIAEEILRTKLSPAQTPE